MSHKAQKLFCLEMRNKFPRHFINANIIDCGSKNINGTNRWLFRRTFWNWKGMNSYTGIDISLGDNVHILERVHIALPKIASMPAKYLVKGKNNKPVWPIDIVISTEMLEHDQFWKESLRAMYDVLRPGGLLLITAGGDGREEHGTKMCTPGASPDTLEYYGNISSEMFKVALPLDMFDKHIIRQTDGDFQFAGVKKDMGTYKFAGAIIQKYEEVNWDEIGK